MNGTRSPQPTKPQTISPEFAHAHIVNVVLATAQRERVSIQGLCILIAVNLVPVFEHMSDVFGLLVYAHPLMEDNYVEVRQGRIDYGDKRLNDMWRFVRRL